MINWFEQLSRREKGLIAIMAGLFICLVVIQFVVRPILNDFSAAKVRHASAERTLKTVTQSAAMLGENQTSQSLKTFNRSELIQTAGTYNLSISRVQPHNTDGLQVWFEEATAQNVLRYVAMLESDYAVGISKLNINRRGEGRVNAYILISPARAP